MIEEDLEIKTHISEELAAEAKTDIEKLSRVIYNIHSNPNNWIVSEIKKEKNEVTRVELKPLDVSPYCQAVFRNCNKTLMMSATILDAKAFCAHPSVPLAPITQVNFLFRFGSLRSL